MQDAGFDRKKQGWNWTDETPKTLRDVRPPKIWKLQKWKNLRKSGQSANESMRKNIFSLKKKGCLFLGGFCLEWAFWELIPIIRNSYSSLSWNLVIWKSFEHFESLDVWVVRKCLPNSFGCGRDVHSTPIVSDGLSEAHHGHLMGGAELSEKVFKFEMAVMKTLAFDGVFGPKDTGWQDVFVWISPYFCCVHS